LLLLGTLLLALHRDTNTCRAQDAAIDSKLGVRSGKKAGRGPGNLIYVVAPTYASMLEMERDRQGPGFH